MYFLDTKIVDDNDKVIKTFIENFYKLQQMNGLIDRMCIQNSIYIKEYLEGKNIKVSCINGILIRIENKRSFKTEHTWIKYNDKIIEPNFYNYLNKNTIVGYYQDWKNCNNDQYKDKNFKPTRSLEQEKELDKICIKQHFIKFFKVLRNGNKDDYLKYLKNNSYIGLLEAGVEIF